MQHDGAQFVIFAGKIATYDQIMPRLLRLIRLKFKSKYKIELVNRECMGHLSRGTNVLKSGSVTVSGAYLMNHGLTLP